MCQGGQLQPQHHLNKQKGSTTVSQSGSALASQNDLHHFFRPSEHRLISRTLPRMLPQKKDLISHLALQQLCVTGAHLYLAHLNFIPQEKMFSSWGGILSMGAPMDICLLYLLRELGCSISSFNSKSFIQPEPNDGPRCFSQKIKCASSFIIP